MKTSRKMALFLAILGLPIFAAAQNQQSAQSANPKFAIKITTPKESVKVGSKVWVDIEWINKSGKKVLTGLVPLAPVYLYQIKVYDETGKMPPRTSAGRDNIDHKPEVEVGSGGPIGPIESVPHHELEDGQSSHQQFDLSELFNFSPGKYTIELDKEDENKTTVKSNVLTITVTP